MNARLVARCHDHKFDPIPAAAITIASQAFFASTVHKDIPRYTPEQQAEWKKKTDPIEAELKAPARETQAGDSWPQDDRGPDRTEGSGISAASVCTANRGGHPRAAHSSTRARTRQFRKPWR
jgi:hypothetical protein